MSDTPPSAATILARRKTQKSPSFCVTIDTPEGLSFLIYRATFPKNRQNFSTHLSPQKNFPDHPPARTQQAFVNQPTTSTPSFPNFSFSVTPHRKSAVFGANLCANWRSEIQLEDHVRTPNPPQPKT
jgi:hypothetical protein